ncbi:MAG: hypothetical protein PVJ09_02885 [Candidatus Woesebacteria bacterium]|jgi:hypothetical protein
MITTIAQVTIDLQEKVAKEGVPFAEEEGGEGMAVLISRMMTLAMVAATILVLLYLIWGAIEWITSGGDSGKVQKARDKIIQAIIGLLVLSASGALIMLIQNFLGIEVLEF